MTITYLTEKGGNALTDEQALEVNLFYMQNDLKGIQRDYSFDVWEI